MTNSRLITVAAIIAMTTLVSGVTANEARVADAAMRGDAAAVRALLREGADVNIAEGDGMTALHFAAEHGDPEVAALLLESGANPRAETRIGHHTPLHIAARGGYAAVVRLLV